jgi:acyl-CoA thioesterase
MRVVASFLRYSRVMSDFDDETRLLRIGEPSGSEQSFTGHVHPGWNIGTNPNGGYLMALAVAGLRQAVPGHPDPLSVTVHYLRPGLAGQPCRVDVQILRTGRTLSTARATLSQEGGPRLEVLAALGVLSTDSAPTLALPAPAMPPPEHCVPRSADEQGVALPILDRLDIRLHPDEARAGFTGMAQVTGWIRFHDGRAPDAVASVLFADAFPPAVFGLLGVVGWVPTVELTVHLRRKPAPGWMLGRFETHDLIDGRLVEDGTLWDADGHLVAQSRQLALLRQGERKT